MGEGADYRKRNSNFIQITDGESIEGVFEGRKFIFKDSFGEEKEYARYTISGKNFDSMSGALAEKFDDIPVGSKVIITRKGEGTATKYEVRSSAESSKPTDQSPATAATAEEMYGEPVGPESCEPTAEERKAWDE